MKMRLFALAFTAPALFASCGDGNTTEEPKDTLPKDNVYTGTVTVSPGTEDEFILEGVQVKFSVDEDNAAAQIDMLHVKFAEAMPMHIDMTIEGIELNSDNGQHELAGDGIIPTAMNGEFPQYTITDLAGTVTSETISFSMMCGVYPLSFKGTRDEQTDSSGR